MAVKQSIDTRLDKLTDERLVTSVAPGIEVTYPEKQAEEAAVQDADIAESFQPMTETPPQSDPILVAGVGLKALKGVLKKAPMRDEVPLVDPNKAMDKIEPYIMVKPAEPQVAEDVLQTAPGMPTTGKPSAPPGVPETVTNLDKITGPDELKQHIEAVGRAFGADKLEKMSYTEVAAKAAEDGYDEAFIARILDPARATQADPREAYKMLLAVTDAGNRAFQLGEKVKAARAAGTLTSELATEFQQAIALEGVLLKAARGRQADIARTLGIFSQARQATAERGAILNTIVNESGGLSRVAKLADDYLALDTRAGRARFAEGSVGGKLTDVWMTTWINGLLSGFTTHAVNIAANTFFGAYQIPERAVASVIGKTRNTLFGGDQAIQMNEVYAQATGMLRGIREGGVISWEAFKKNQPTDPFQKIESSRMGRDPFEIDMGDSVAGKAMANALRYWGNFVTIPGRALMAEDEFFKGVAYRMELNALATRAANDEYARLVKTGMPSEDAANEAAAYMTRTLQDPPDDMVEAAGMAARTVTFTRELEPALQGMQRTLQNPLLKMFVPFVRTPTNITLEAMSRTPGLNFGSPRFWADYNAGGIKRDMALARVTLGGALIYGAGSLALDGNLTGYGPFRKGDKDNLKAQGWQEFSFVFDKKNVSPALIEQFKEITNVSVGPDKVYISYARLDPLSSLLSVAATAGEMSMTTGNEVDYEKLFMGGALGMYTYLGDTPMLQGFADLFKTFTSKAEDGPTWAYNMLRQSSKQASSVVIGGSPLGVHSALVASVERYVDPTKRSVIVATDPDKVGPTSGALKGWWEAVGTYKSRNPLLSDELPPVLDPITGQPQKVGKGNLYEMFSPYKQSDGKYSPAHMTLMRYRMPITFPDKKVQGVELTDKQYYRLIEIATADGQLEDDIVSIGSDDALISLASEDLEQAQAYISSVIEAAYKNARELLIEEDPDLADKVRRVKETKAVEGKFKR